MCYLDETEFTEQELLSDGFIIDDGVFALEEDF